MLNPLSIPIGAVKGFFGRELTTFQTQIRPDQVVQILSHDPRSKNWKNLPLDLRTMYEYLQRKTSRDRRESTAEYIEQRLAPEAITIGAFPAICVGMVRPGTFRPIVTDDESSPLAAVGTLHLELSDSNRRIILDGLARVTGALEVLERSDRDRRVGDWFSFPVTIYAPTREAITLEQLGQLFHDFNFLQTPVSANQAIALDKSDLYIQLTNVLGRSETLKRYGGMEERAASLGTKSTAIVVQRVLLRFVRGATEGRRFQESNLSRTETPNLNPTNFRDVERKLEEFISTFANRMGVDRFKDRDSLHLSAPGWQVLGLVFHDIHFRLGAAPRQYEDLLDRLSQIDWSRYNSDWIGMVGEPERHPVTQQVITDERGRQRVALSRAGRTTIAAMLKYVREKSGLSELLGDSAEDLDEEAFDASDTDVARTAAE
jgi:hypothetical protein